MQKILILLSVFFTSCSLPKLYRATIGFSSNNTQYKSTKNIDGKSVESTVCVKEVNENIDNPEKCGEGYKQDNGVSILDPWIEFKPSYFGNSNIGFSYFFIYNNSNTTLLDYPIKDTESEIVIQRYALNPILYYNFGDKYISSNSGTSFRIGIGSSFNNISQFRIKRLDTNDIYQDQSPLKTGWSAFFEYNLSWFTFRVEHSSVTYDQKKFNDIAKDNLKIETNKASIYYSY